MTFADEKVPVFEKPFRLTQDVTLDKSLKPGATRRRRRHRELSGVRRQGLFSAGIGAGQLDGDGEVSSAALQGCRRRPDRSAALQGRRTFRTPESSTRRRCRARSRRSRPRATRARASRAVTADPRERPAEQPRQRRHPERRAQPEQRHVGEPRRRRRQRRQHQRRQRAAAGEPVNRADESGRRASVQAPMWMCAGAPWCTWTRVAVMMHVRPARPDPGAPPGRSRAGRGRPASARRRIRRRRRRRAGISRAQHHERPRRPRSARSVWPRPQQAPSNAAL